MAEPRLSLELLDDEHEIVPVVTSAAPSTPREWTYDQLLRLLRAWRDVLEQQENEEVDEEVVTEPLTSRIYERVIVLCVDEEAYEEAFNDVQSQVPEMQDALIATYGFIARFNASCGKVKVRMNGKVVARRSMNWFAISEREQRKTVEKQFTGPSRFLFCVDEAMYEVIDSILGVEDDEEAQLDAMHAKSQSSLPLLLVDQDAVASQVTPSPTFELPSFETTEDVSTLTEAELLPELAAIEANLPPNVWRRDEIFQLIRAWGAALTDLSDEIPSRPTTEFKNNVFEHYCSEVEGGEEATRRTAVSSWTKIQSLARSFQFITDFNHDRINWMTPGVQISKPNSWYELSESYQNWIVKKYFRAKNEHTAFSSLYNDMLAPIATNIRASPEWWPPRTHYPKAASRLKKEKRKQKKKTPTATQNSISRPENPTKKPSVKLETADRPKKMGRKPNWNDDEVENLMRAWGEVVKESVAEKKLSAGVSNAQVFKKFLALCGGVSRRDLPQICTKVSSLIESCAFISDFDENKIPSLAGSSSDMLKRKPWFTLSEPKQREIVAIYFKSCHTVRFTYITADMVPVIAEYSKTWLGLTPRQEPVVRRRGKGRPVVWSRDELVLLLHSWLEIVAAHRQVHERDTSLIDRIHSQFQVLCGGKSTKRASAISFQTRELLSSYNRLRAYFRNHALSEETRNQWFSKSESERREILRAETNQHAYNVNLDGELFDLMQQIAQANRQAKSVSQTRPESAAQKKPRGQLDGSSVDSEDGDFKMPRKRGIEDHLIAQKKQKLEPRPALKSALYIEQQDQIRLLMSMLDQVREERNLEHEERRREREERQQEREEVRRELEDWRQERLLERENYRTLLRELREAVVPGTKENQFPSLNV